MRSSRQGSRATRRAARWIAIGLLSGACGVTAAAPQFRMQMQTPQYFDTGNIGTNGADALGFSFVLLNGETANPPFTLRTTLPEHVSYRAGVGAGWSCAWNPPVVTCTYAYALTAANWSSAGLGIHIDVDTDLPVPGSSPVRMTLENAQTPLPDPPVCTSSASFNSATSDTGCVQANVAHRQSELKFLPVTWQHWLSTFEAGTRNTVGVGFQNLGFGQNNGTVSARFLLPPGLLFATAGGQVPWNCSAAAPDPQGQLVTCTTPYFFDGMGPQQANITVHVDVTSDVAVPGPVPIYATISNAAQPPPDFSLCDDAAPPVGCGYYLVPTRAARVSRMDIVEIEPLQARSNLGEEALVVVRYTNLGEGNASAVTLALSLPPGFAYNRRFGASPAMDCAVASGTPTIGQTLACTYGASYPPGIGGTITLGLNVVSGAAVQSLLVASVSDDGLPGPSLPQCLADPADPEPMIGCGRALLEVSPWIFCNGFEALPRICGQPQPFP